MGAIKVKFHSEQEEKVLLTILDSLNYDYEPQYSSQEEVLINEALGRSEKDFIATKQVKVSCIPYTSFR